MPFHSWKPVECNCNGSEIWCYSATHTRTKINVIKLRRRHNTKQFSKQSEENTLIKQQEQGMAATELCSRQVNWSCDMIIVISCRDTHTLPISFLRRRILITTCRVSRKKSPVVFEISIVTEITVSIRHVISQTLSHAYRLQISVKYPQKPVLCGLATVNLQVL